MYYAMLQTAIEEKVFLYVKTIEMPTIVIMVVSVPYVYDLIAAT